MRSIWQTSRMIAIAVVIVLGAGAIALARPLCLSEIKHGHTDDGVRQEMA